MPKLPLLLAFLVGFALPLRADTSAAMNPIAESYVKLALAAGVHDGDFVDAYFGPSEWQAAAAAEKLPLADILERTRALRARLATLDPAGLDDMGRLRHEYLTKQLRAMEARLETTGGRKFRFDEESGLLFDAVAPTHSEEHFRALVTELDAALPGRGRCRNASRPSASNSSFRRTGSARFSRRRSRPRANRRSNTCRCRRARASRWSM